MAIGVFGLQVAYKLKRLEVMSIDDTHGWFGGGTSPGPFTFSTVDRIDFSNDTGTASPRSPLSSARYNSAATGNSNYGWFGGGVLFNTPSRILYSTVDRINFSNDSTTASVRGSLSSVTYGSAATGNSNYGWFGGGAVSVIISRVDRIDFSNDSSTASVRGPLSSVRYKPAATGNSNYAWFGGGIFPGLTILSRVDRIDFSNDSSTASPRGPLSLTRIDLAATGNSNYGWFGGGYAPTTNRTTVDRINFSNDLASASPRGPLSLARSRLAATSGQAKGPAIKLQKAGNYGWFGGGILFPNPVYSAVDRIDFSNDSSTASPRGSLSLARYTVAATGNSNYGWFGGGRVPGSPQINYSTVDRIDFSNDSSTASPRGPLSSVRNWLAATGNSNYGWFGGGSTPVVTVSIVDRINFSNDLASASIRGPLNSVQAEIAATGNSNYGWFGGTFPNLAHRIDFSNDSSTASLRGPLSLGRNPLAATGNSNYGWFGGGAFPTVSRVDRIDFSNDNATASIRGPLSQSKQALAATGNSNYGWFGGGWFSPSSPQINYSTVDRIDFSNDSATAVARSMLTGARYSHAATSNTPT